MRKVVEIDRMAVTYIERVDGKLTSQRRIGGGEDDGPEKLGKEVVREVPCDWER